MHTGFAGNAETEPEERAGWRMRTDFAGDAEVCPKRLASFGYSILASEEEASEK